MSETLPEILAEMRVRAHKANCENEGISYVQIEDWADRIEKALERASVPVASDVPATADLVSRLESAEHPLCHEAARRILAQRKRIAQLLDRDGLRRIVALVTWDDEGAVGPVEPAYSWETVARMALDYARAALSEPHTAPGADLAAAPLPPAPGTKS